MSAGQVRAFRPALTGGAEGCAHTAPPPSGRKARGWRRSRAETNSTALPGGRVCLPPSFIYITPPRCSVCNADYKSLINPTLNPPNHSGYLCPSCFVAACPWWWKRHGDEIHQLMERNFCQLSKAAARHVALLTFFVPALKGVSALEPHAAAYFYGRKEDWICMYAFDKEQRPREDYFLLHADIERNVFQWMKPSSNRPSNRPSNRRASGPAV